MEELIFPLEEKNPFHIYIYTHTHIHISNGSQKTWRDLLKKLILLTDRFVPLWDQSFCVSWSVYWWIFILPKSENLFMGKKELATQTFVNPINVLLLQNFKLSI